jgi:Uma2 family endonuclease
VRPYTEQRLQVAAKNYRVPDVCVVRLGTPPGRIIQTAPLICIEVLSPEDSLNDIRPRIDDYVAMGVSNIWILDPVRRLAWIADAAGYHLLPSDRFSVPETPIAIALADIYTELDDMAAGR